MAKQIRWQRHRHSEANVQTKRQHGEVNTQIFNLSLRKHDSDSCSVYSPYIVTVMCPSTTEITLLVSQLMNSLFVKSHSWAFKNLFFLYNFLSLCCKHIFYSNIIFLHGNLIFERPTSKTEAILLSLSCRKTRHYLATNTQVGFQNFTYPSFMTIPIPLDIFETRTLYTKIRGLYCLGVKTAGS